METKECGNCLSWKLTKGAVQNGSCLAMPPRVFMRPDGEFITLFPETHEGDRCGYFVTRIPKVVEVNPDEDGGLAT